jgi:NAD(P)-dependent dehydrogenase (short-subunit alcohol dehydrogenase family)
MPVPAPAPDSRAVVTGASQGIGAALAGELAARGHHLIITARRAEVLADLAARLMNRYGVTVEVRAVDLADPGERAGLADELAGRDISILCANAGTATFGPVAELDPAAEQALAEGSEEELRLILLALREPVSMGQPARCKEGLAALAAASWPAALSDEVAQLVGAIRGYRYDEARILLRRLIDRI